MENNGSNAKILTETGRAVKGLVVAGENLQKIVGGLNVFTQEVAQLVEQIDIKSGELQQLDGKFADKLRQHKIDLKFKIQENEEIELDALLGSRGLISVKADTIDLLEANIKSLTESKDSAVTAEVAKVKASMTSDHNNALKMKELEHSTNTAQTKAELEGFKSKVKYLEEALATANKALDAERAARIEIAGNTSQPTINVNGK